MSFLMRQVAHCDVCGHEWIVIAAKTPSHCASCKSRRWNKAAVPDGYADGQSHSAYLRERQAAKPNNTAPVHAPTCKCLMCKPPR